MRLHDLKPGDRVYFATDVRPFRVQVAGDRYVIATKPFNVQRTVLYTILDIEEQRRGPDDRVFSNHDYCTQEDCASALTELEAGDMDVSWRRGIRLEVERVVRA